MKGEKLNYLIFRATIKMVVIGMVTGIILSCEDKKQRSTDAIENDSLFIKYTALTDSVDKEWQIMIADDDDKHMLMKRLLLEVSYTNNYDKERFRELGDLIDQLKAMRYDQKSMGVSASIDAYDSATFDLSDQIILFARSHPRYADFPLMVELIDNINEKNNYILMHRIHYDTRVKEFNSFRKSNRKKLLPSDPEIEVMPLFELSS